MRLLRQQSRTPIRLGAALGRGGEGTVYAVHGHSNLVAKIYAKRPTPLKAEKLQTMVRSATPGMLKIAAWPLDVLVDEQRVPRGFLMPKVASREDLHELYSPKSRAETFPEADFRFVVRVAANLARAFAAVHAQGHVIGDVNHGNALVGHDATVMLIDCDSFQTRDRIKTYACDVGVALFTAPELQGRDFRGLRRSRNHDAFGLGILIFHLLFQGRHPFAGVFAPGEITIERAIAEHRFVYGANAAAHGMSAPPGTLDLSAFGNDIARLFARSFETKAADGERPSAIEWVSALETLEASLTPCTGKPTHFHPRSSPCCWCALEARVGLRLFGRRIATRIDSFDIDALWRAIAAVSHPGPLPPPPTEQTQLPRKPRSRSFSGMLRTVLGKVSIATAVGSAVALVAGYVAAVPIMLASVLIAIVANEPAARVRARRASLELAVANWESNLKRWQRECSSHAFDDALADLRRTRLEIAELSKQCAEEVDKYLKLHLNAGLRGFLAAYRIDQAPQGLLTPGQRAKLTAHGIHTAADIHRDEALVSHIISSGAAERLLAWYRMHVRGFSGAVNRTPDPAKIGEIRNRFASRQAALAERLRDGPQLLQKRQKRIAEMRKRLAPNVRFAARQLQLAQRQSE